MAVISAKRPYEDQKQVIMGYPGTWASYQLRTIAGCACAGNAANFFPATDFTENR